MFLLEIPNCYCAANGGPETCYYSGIYGGVLYIITGACGIRTTHRDSKCLLVTTLVLSSFSALVAAVCNITSYGVGIDVYNYIYFNYTADYWNYDMILAALCMSCILIVISVAQLTLFIIQSAFACAVCCHNNASSNSAHSVNNAAPYYIPSPQQPFHQGDYNGGYAAPNQFGQVPYPEQYQHQPIYYPPINQQFYNPNQQFAGGQFAKQPMTGVPPLMGPPMAQYDTNNPGTNNSQQHQRSSQSAPPCDDGISINQGRMNQDRRGQEENDHREG